MDYQFAVPATMNFVKGGLAAGTTTTISTTAALTYALRGKLFTKGTMTNQATPTTDFATGKAFIPVPALNCSAFVLGLDASGNLQCVQGTVTALNAQTGGFLQAPQFGGQPLGMTPFGYILIQAGATASSTPGWTFGASNMSAVTGITYFFDDIATWPDRPQVA